MIKGSKLIGRSVVDMEAAEKLGKVKEIIVQQDGERVAGFVVSHSENILGTGGTRRTIPASALNAIGPDAITVRGSGVTELAELESLPRMSDVIGHKMVTQSGRLLGAIDDILIDPKDGTIVGFLVGEDIKSKLENMFNADRAHTAGYVRADADLHVGNDLIVVPDDAFVAGDPEALTKEPETATGAGAVDPALPKHGWATEPRMGTPRRSLWSKRTTASGASVGADEVEGWIPGDFSKSLSSEPHPAERATSASTVEPMRPKE
ncbi:MAG: PRC-barrel domain-containing protein [Chthoniobacterales bacterium]|nr:PRC-barrel domain-containing protein [Chthoniobacterales bacterium]